MDPSHWRPMEHRSRLPRTRGDGPSPSSRSGPGPEASPHTRGWTRRRPVALVAGDGFPAHAGMDPRGSSGPGSARWLPRTRGDGPRSQITRKANKNRVCWLFGVQINADLSRNDPRGAGSAGSTAGSTAFNDQRPFGPAHNGRGIPAPGRGPGRGAGAQRCRVRHMTCPVTGQAQTELVRGNSETTLSIGWRLLADIAPTPCTRAGRASTIRLALGHS